MGLLLIYEEDEVKALDIFTRKMLNMYKYFSMKDDVDKLYVSHQRRWHSILSTEDVLHYEQLLASY